MDEAIKKAKAYSKTKHYLAIFEMILSLAFFITIQISGLSAYISELTYSICKNSYLAAVFYIIFLAIPLEIIIFPLTFFSSFAVEHRYHLSKQNLLSWFKDYLKTLTIGGLFYLIMIVILYYFLRNSLYWWLYTALVYLFLSLVLAMIFPVIIIPLFYRLDRFQESPLKERLMALAKKAGIKVMDIYNIGLGEKTNKANAALCGWGATRRILVSDTLLKTYADDEIESTLAHELAHYKRRHFWKLNFYNFLVTLLGFGAINLVLINLPETDYIQHIYVLIGNTDYLRHIYNIGVFPILATIFIIYTIVVTPLLNFISRRYEAEADTEAVALTEKPLAFANLIRKLSMQNLSDPSPRPLIKFFFYNHPPAEERIARCVAVVEKYKQN